MTNSPSRNNRQPSPPGSNADYGSSDQYIQKTAYDGTMEVVNKRLDALEARVKDKAAVVATLKEVLEDDRNIDPIMTDYLTQHVNIEPLVKKHVDSLDGRQFKAIMKKAGYALIGLVYTLALIAATAWITTTVNNHTDTATSTSNHAGHQ